MCSYVHLISKFFQACGEYAQLAQTQGRKWQRMLAHEHEQRRRLEDMVEQLARQHSHLEQAAQQQARVANPNSSGGTGHSAHSEEDDENEFFDAEDEVKADLIVQVPIGHRRTPSGVSTASQVSFLLNGWQKNCSQFLIVNELFLSFFP